MLTRMARGDQAQERYGSQQRALIVQQMDNPGVAIQSWLS